MDATGRRCRRPQAAAASAVTVAPTGPYGADPGWSRASSSVAAIAAAAAPAGTAARRQLAAIISPGYPRAARTARAAGPGTRICVARRLRPADGTHPAAGDRRRHDDT